MKSSQCADFKDKTIREDFQRVIDELTLSLYSGSALEKRPITIKSIAIKAGHSRSLIAQARCAYPEIRESALKLIQIQKDGRKPSSALKDAVLLRGYEKMLKSQQDQIYTLQCRVENLEARLKASELGRDNLRRENQRLANT